MAVCPVYVDQIGCFLSYYYPYSMDSRKVMYLYLRKLNFSCLAVYKYFVILLETLNELQITQVRFILID